MSSIHQIESLESKMFDAALGELGFDRVLQAMTSHFGASGGVLFELNRATGEIGNWVGPGLESGAKDYIEHLNAINPRMRYSRRHAAGHVVYEGLFTNDSAMDRNEFYDAIMRLSGVRYFLGSRLYDEGDISVFHSLEFEPRAGHPDRDKINAFSSSSTNLGKAWKLAKTRAAPEDGNDDGFVFEHLPWAIFSIDEQCRIAPANSNAHEFLTRGDVLSLTEGRLLAANARVNDALLNLARSALAGRVSSVVLPIGSVGEPAILQTLPVPGKRQAFLFVRNPSHYSDSLERIAPKLFGLTAMESRILAVLSRGAELQSVADELHLSRNTVRNHLNSIYRKTGAKNRADLLVRIFSV